MGIFVLDEADEMLSRGFKDQIYDIFKVPPPSVQVALFSATMPPDILDLTSKFMRDPKSTITPATLQQPTTTPATLQQPTTTPATLQQPVPPAPLQQPITPATPQQPITPATLQ